MTEVHSCSYYCDRPECIKAQRDELRERLAQPNDFNPDWDAMAVMVEEQQRMAKRIEELEAQPVALETVYETIIQWDEGGGKRSRRELARRIVALYTSTQPEQELVAWEDVLGAIARGWTHDDNKHKTMDVQLAVAIAKEIQDMVIAPPQRKPLTDEERMNMWHTTSFRGNGGQIDWFIEGIRAAEAAHDIKGEA